MLQIYRNNKDKWQEFTYCKADSSSDIERKAKARYALLIALQYGLDEQDENLVRYLFEQEIKAHENHSFGGINESLTLNAFLLAKFKNPNDIPLFYNAKNTNFDTYCGFDSEFIFYALGDHTEAFVKQNFPELLDDIKEYSSNRALESTLDDWWQHLNNEFPDDENNEDLLTLFYRNIYLDKLPLAREYLEKWKNETPDSAAKNNTLKFAYIKLGDYFEVIELLEIELQTADSHWDRTGCYTDLLNYYTKTQQPSNGLTTIKFIQQELSQFSDWKNTGLGRMTIEQIFEFSLNTEDSKIALEAFSIANSLLSKLKDNISYEGLETAWKSAVKLSLTTDAEILYKRLLAEKNRIENIDNGSASKRWYQSIFDKLFGNGL